MMEQERLRHKLMKARVKLLALISLTLLFAVFIVETNGQQSLSPKIAVAPHTFELDVFPGETRQEKIKVLNQSEAAIPISTRIIDFTAEEDSGRMVFDESAADLAVAARKWIAIENPDFILDPGETERVKLSIKIPEEAEPGGHYAIALFEATLPPFYFKEGQTRAIPSLGVLFLFSVKTFSLEPVPQGQKIEIVQFGIPRNQRMEKLERIMAAGLEIIPGVRAAEINIVEKVPSSFLLRVKNNDIFHHKLEGKLVVFDVFGKETGEAVIKKTTILPGKTREIPVEFKPEISRYGKWLPALASSFLVQNVPFGAYRVSLELAEEREDLTVDKALDFWAFPWKIILAPILLLGLLVVMRKRIKTALKILVRS